MGIEFDCPMCGKHVRAPDAACGKRGKCPYCKESVYIPRPPEEREEIPLAPIDESEAVRERELREEAQRLAAALDKDLPGKYDTGEAPPADHAMPPPRDFEVDVPELVNEYLAAMAASDMARADPAVRQLKSAGAEAKKHVQQLMVDELPPAKLGDLPAPLYKGFLRSLLKRL